jgi:hypothetical protein
MLKVSNSMPISNYSQVVISDNAGATFRPKTNSRIRIELPTTLGMVDFHSSVIQFETKIVPHADMGTKNSFQVGFGNMQGVEQIVRDLIIRVDGRPLETITNYNVLDKLRKDFANDLTLNNIQSVFNAGTLASINPSYFIQDWNVLTSVATYNQNPVKNQIQLDLSGLLSMKTGFPIVATGAVEIEIILEDAENCLLENQHLSTTLADIPTATTGADGSLTGVFVHADILAKYGWTQTNNPFFVGNIVKTTGKFNGVGFEYYSPVDAVTADGTGIKVGASYVAGFLGGDAQAVTDVVLEVLFNVNDPADKTTAPSVKTTEEYKYEVSNVEFIARSIEMPPPYLSALQKRIQGEGLVMDCPTYTMYLSNILPNINKQSLLVPCYSSRVKGILSIPLSSNQTSYAYNRRGQVDGLREYQIKIGSRVEPQRPVDLTNWTTSGNAQYPSQEHIQELSKTLVACGIGERSLAYWRDNFVMSRSLSAMGGSEDLSDKGARWEIQYNTTTNTAKSVYNFVNSVKRLQIVPTGVNIFG